MRISQIWRYPIKSIGGESLATATVDVTGLTGDRGWGLADPASGTVLTARREPRLLLATCRLVDSHPVTTTPAGDELHTSADYSDWLGRPVELVAAGDTGGTFENPMDPFGETDWISWTGPAQAWHDSGRTRVSLVSTASLGNWDPRRFRANIILEGDGEDALVDQSVRLGTCILDITKQIDRCVMVTRPQPGLDRDLDVLKTLIRERANRLAIGGLVAEPGRIDIGDELTKAGEDGALSA
ncbi:MAG: MOSC domain-containing protein [Acidimicrobiaceae bacterium]|jgi:hypothetical protein|nr:MOSC domain-containing protein [Acidimicrobiaceae bacterium]MBT5849855.1 MOSC domain-containing protein [Acidimicrobiaceae bacterium]MDG1409202.1 MOSC N-terminal beta barrel domain-containing protein [Acidimicrobiales bacterium]MDG2218343.1 MOSC N-terminal beta barrel domain-containing protein [Acidimicrobiales bacterium]